MLFKISVVFLNIICIAAKPKAIQIEEPSNTGIEQNLSGNPSHDRELIHIKE